VNKAQLLLPYHPHPKDDELLTSWLLRIASGFGLKLHSFTGLVVPGFQVWNRDIDRSAPTEMLSMLSEQTGLSYHGLFNMTLRAYEGYAFEKFNPTGSTPMICPLGIWHRKRKSFGQAYCPQCLYESVAEPYFQRKWRLAFSVSCAKHQLQLYDCCPHCGAPIAYHRHDFANKSVPYRQSVAACFRCHHALYDCEWIEEREQRLLDFQKAFEILLSCGWISIANAPIYSFQYLRVVKQIMRIFFSNRPDCQKFKRLCSSKAQIEMPQLQNNPDVEYARISDRRMSLKIALWVLLDWPERFIQVGSESHIYRTTFAKDLDSIPYWFDKVLWDSFDGRTYNPSSQEIHYAADFLKSTRQKVNKSTLLCLMGFRDSTAIAHYLNVNRTETSL
jgi:hypothetical protein